MTAILDDGQYDVDGFLLGEGTPYRVTSYEDQGLAERVVQDTQRDGFDGVVFGRDTFAGLAPTWEVMVETAGGGAAFDAVGDLLRVWRGDAVRRNLQAVQVFRFKRPGRETVRLYGRTRRATPTRSRNTGVGLVPVVLDAAAVDDRYYADVAESLVVPIVPGEAGGFLWPADGVEFPLSTIATGETRTTLTHGGDVDTWPIVTFTGPIDRPGLELLDAGGAVVWRIVTTGALAHGQSVTLDYRPWGRTIRRETGASVPGFRSRSSTPADECRIPPGASAVRFTGSDATGEATCRIDWRKAYAAA